jgi:replication-associated recombination protein RarA
LKNRTYYHPTGEGVEKRIRDRMQELAKLRAGLRKKNQEEPSE